MTVAVCALVRLPRELEGMPRTLRFVPPLLADEWAQSSGPSGSSHLRGPLVPTWPQALASPGAGGLVVMVAQSSGERPAGTLWLLNKA